METTAMQINKEEMFGPITCVIKADDYDHALGLANDTGVRVDLQHHHPVSLPRQSFQETFNNRVVLWSTCRLRGPIIMCLSAAGKTPASGLASRDSMPPNFIRR